MIGNSLLIFLGFKPSRNGPVLLRELEALRC